MGGCDRAGLAARGETNNTAEVSFENRSNTNSAYDVMWNGARITTLAPGQVSLAMNVGAGVEHTLIFVFAKNGRYACDRITLTLPQCVSRNYSCNG